MVEGYGPHGAMQRVRYDNGLVEAAGYNPRLQMTGLHAAKWDGAAYSDRLRLSFDFGTSANNGNLLGQTMISGGKTWTQSYTFDKFNRLKTAGEAAVSPGTGWTQSFGYDRYGNRGLLSGLADGTETLSVAQEADIEGLHPNNRDSRATPDGAGNVIAFSTTSATYEFDGENRMTRSAKPVLPSGEQVVVYEYDGEGRRVRKTVSPGAGQETTVYVYEASGALAQEYGGTAESGRRYLTVDHLGSTRLTTDGAGAVAKRYDYTPFGRQLFAGDNGRDAIFPGAEPQSVDPMKVRFTGQQRDTETGLDYFGARYLSSAMGRFTSPDPIAVTGARLVDPQMFNLYVYTRNNPLRFVDPAGLEPYPAPCAGPTSGNCYSNLSEGEQRYEESLWERGKAMFLALVAPGVEAHSRGYEPQAPASSGPFPTGTEVSKQLADALAKGTGVTADILELLDPTGFGSATRSGLTGDVAGTVLAMAGIGLPGGRSGGKIALSEAKGKANEFLGETRTARNVQKTIREDNTTKYIRNGRYIIVNSDSRILSFGNVR